MATPEHHANSGTPSAHDVGGGIMEEAKYIWHDVRLLIHDHLKLATLETKLVAESLVSMIATSVAVVLLVVTAWLGLVSAGVVAMIEQGLSSPSASRSATCNGRLHCAACTPMRGSLFPCHPSMHKNPARCRPLPRCRHQLVCLLPMQPDTDSESGS